MAGATVKTSAKPLTPKGKVKNVKGTCPGPKRK